ncbi:unnamed protein product [marine sediment metagenome]|uniref:Uncharacterized protein n=4 Tax=marine sediment metagenome TaxID=412755 RepID=X1N6M3_9ZZZZ
MLPAQVDPTVLNKERLYLNDGLKSLYVKAKMQCFSGWGLT